MTPSQLIEALDRLPADAAQAQSLLIPQGDTPLVFVCPGVGGDESALAGLGAELGNQVRFVIIRYISSTAMFATKARFDAIADAIVKRIRQAIDHHHLFHVVGYSFGGFVAWAVAHRLLTDGFRVGAIGLIDARRTRRTTTTARAATTEEAGMHHLSQFCSSPAFIPPQTGTELTD